MYVGNARGCGFHGKRVAPISMALSVCSIHAREGYIKEGTPICRSHFGNEIVAA